MKYCKCLQNNSGAYTYRGVHTDFWFALIFDSPSSYRSDSEPWYMETGLSIYLIVGEKGRGDYEIESKDLNDGM